MRECSGSPTPAVSVTGTSMRWLGGGSAARTCHLCSRGSSIGCESVSSPAGGRNDSPRSSAGSAPKTTCSAWRAAAARCRSRPGRFRRPARRPRRACRRPQPQPPGPRAVPDRVGGQLVDGDHHIVGAARQHPGADGELPYCCPQNMQRARIQSLIQRRPAAIAGPGGGGGRGFRVGPAAHGFFCPRRSNGPGRSPAAGEHRVSPDAGRPGAGRLLQRGRRGSRLTRSPPPRGRARPRAEGSQPPQKQRGKPAAGHCPGSMASVPAGE